MQWSLTRAAYVFFGLLVVLACAPLASFLEQTTLSPTATNVMVLPSETDFATNLETPTMLSTPVPTSTNMPTVQPPLATPTSELYAFIQAPEGPLAQPYVTLIAFQSVPDASVIITGIVNSNEFICRGSPCSLPVLTSSNILFRAMSDNGYTSEDVSATVRVEYNSDGYYVYLDTLSQFASFSDSCLRFWKIQDYTDPVWAEFVQFPYLLNTDKTLHHLVTRLIIHGIVDVSGCPGGGLNAGFDWPTGCGLERAKDAMIEWQNQYNEYIWLASKEIGIPPKILKTLIEVESQFWPGNERFYLDEVGLGQLNQFGVDVLLRRNPTLYQQVCSAVLDDCAIPYSLMPSQNQAMIRGAFVSSLDSDCPSCEHGLDLNAAKQSISFVAQVLYSNCETVKVIADANRPAGYIDDLEDPYSDFWKFTLFAYHSGISCFEKAVKATPQGLPLNWENLSVNVGCNGGKEYADGIWDNLLSFDSYRHIPTDYEIAQVTPEFGSTRTPFPTPVSSTAQVNVQVFLDVNQNGIAEHSELMDGVPILLQAKSGIEVTGSTVDGHAAFTLSRFPIGSEVVVSLPGLYRSETIIVPEQGILPLTFMFTQPALPTVIP